MDYQKRYTGQFVSREGHTWQCDILQYTETFITQPGELRFEAEEPLVIEWHEADKEVPLVTSSATLRIESPGDRTYEDLYSIGVGEVRLDILRDGRLFWSGTLDPEFYEEPYERASHYPVTLTFSDFGALDRLKFDGTGVLTLSSIVSRALERACLRFDALDFSTLTSLEFPPEDAEFTGERATLDRLAIVADNFYDEDGEPSTLREVVEGILQPLALRMVQRDGQVWIYDLNALYLTATEPSAICWTGDSQTLSVDRVANSVRINFSAYAQAGAITDKVTFGGKFTGREPQILPFRIKGTYADGDFYRVGDKTSREPPGEEEYLPEYSFVLYTSKKGHGVEGLHHAAFYGSFFPANMGSEGAGEAADCIVWRAQVLNHKWRDGNEYMDKIVGIYNHITPNYPPECTLFSTRAVYLPDVSKVTGETLEELNNRDCSIGIKMELLADPRYNPFRKADYDNEADIHDAMRKHCWLVRVPVGIGLYNSKGEPYLHLKANPTNRVLEWEPGAPSYADRMFLDYGSATDGENDCGIFGWNTNGNIDTSPLPDTAFKGLWSKYGLVIPYPTGGGGWLRVFVYEGLYVFNDNESSKIWLEQGTPPGLIWVGKGYCDKLRWLCYKAPEVTIYSNRQAMTKADLDDIEYTGYINRAAKEEMTLDTICGTHSENSPTARGVYLYERIYPVLDFTEFQQLHHLRRAGHTDHPERLLIGTLISQYSRRMTMLSGECAADLSAHVFTEANQPGKLFMKKGEVLDAINDTAEATFVEFRPDEWTAIEETD